MALQSIAFPFQRGPKSLPKIKEDGDSILDSLRSLILTTRGERVMRPTLGTNAAAYVFDSMTAITKARITQEIRNTIVENEPRVEVLMVSVTEGGGTEDTTLKVEIVYRAKNKTATFAVDLG